MKWLITLLLYFPMLLFGQSWQEIPPVPGSGRDDGVAFSIKGFGYVVTGNLSGFNGSNKLWCYDPVNNNWTEKSTFPGIPRQYAGSFVLNNEGYILCGIGEGNIPLNDCWKYNPISNSWTQIADLPAAPRWSVFSFASPFAGYVGTGGSAAELLKDAWKYNPNSDSWSQIADYPGGQFRETAYFSTGEKAVVTLGYNNEYNFLPLTFELNMLTDTWTQAADFPGPGRSYATGGSTSDYGYIAGGITKENVFFNEMTRYDFETKSWSAAGNLPIAGIKGMAAFTLNDIPFFVTGIDSDLNRTGNGWKIIDEQGKAVKPMFFPNPSRGELIIKANNGASVRLLTTDGKLYRSFTIENQNTLWIDQLNPGGYIVEILSEGNKTVEKLIVY